MRGRLVLFTAGGFFLLSDGFAVLPRETWKYVCISRIAPDFTAASREPLVGNLKLIFTGAITFAFFSFLWTTLALVILSSFLFLPCAINQTEQDKSRTRIDRPYLFSIVVVTSHAALPFTFQLIDINDLFRSFMRMYIGKWLIRWHFPTGFLHLQNACLSKYTIGL